MSTYRNVLAAGAAACVGMLGCTNPADAPVPSVPSFSQFGDSIAKHILISGGPLGVAVSNNIAYVTQVSAATVARVNLVTDSVTGSITVGSVPSLIAFNPAGTKAYVANQASHNVGIIDVASGLQTDTIPVTGDPFAVAVSGNGATLFVTTNVNRLYKINISTKAVLDSLALPQTSHHLLRHPLDTLLYVATRNGGSVLEVNWRTMAVVRTFTLGGRTQGMAISPDRTELYVANETANVLHVVNLTSGATADTVPLSGGGEGLALSGDGNRLYVGLVFAGKVEVINRSTHATLSVVTTGGMPREIAADSARASILVANQSGWVDVLR